MSEQILEKNLQRVGELFNVSVGDGVEAENLKIITTDRKRRTRAKAVLHVFSPGLFRKPARVLSRRWGGAL
jgi:hypothetical protein